MQGLLPTPASTTASVKAEPEDKLIYGPNIKDWPEQAAPAQNDSAASSLLNRSPIPSRRPTS
ncbi:hypothetical protein [Gemmiger formicilis]|uniref:hypothetical protein n=1 Tax=Gemmiger formicilis TaxID=745368 RepID=UPI00399BC02D